jgi:hypothetical protein
MSKPFRPIVVKSSPGPVYRFPQAPQRRPETQIRAYAEPELAETIAFPIYLEGIKSKPVPGFNSLVFLDPEKQHPIPLPEISPSTVTVAVDFSHSSQFVPDIA